MKTISFLNVIFKYLCKISFALAIITLPFCAIGQQHLPDSILNLTYKQYDEYFEKYSTDTAVDRLYACAYLLKAKYDKDTLKIANAFYHLSNLNTDFKTLSYTDSIIFITKDKNYKLYPERGYLNKGNCLSLMGNYEKALENYYITYDIAKKKKNILFYNTAKFNIAVLKNRLGNTQEALNIFKEYVNYIENNKVKNQKQLLSIGLLNLGDAFFFLGKYDSSEFVINRGLKISNSLSDTYLYPNFLIRHGAILYKKKKYKQAVDSLNKAQTYFNDDINNMIANLYLGKIQYEQSNYKQALGYFTLIDSFMLSSGNVDAELLEMYPLLIEYYRSKKDIEKQLHNTNQLLKFDSIYSQMHNNSMNSINNKFNVTELLESKEELVKSLQEETSIFKRNIYILLFISLSSIFAIIYFVARNRVYKKRFKQILNKPQPDNKDVIITQANLNEIDKTLIEDILGKLHAFESSSKFTNQNVTLIILAKDLKTNSRYLSKIINEYKGCNFANYINNLRIGYAIEKLKSDEKFRSYTIKAMSEEIGFKTAQSFSLAFYKNTGIYPSLFLKQLKSLKDS